MAQGINNITKIGIIVITVILGFFAAYNLFEVLTDNQDFGEIDKILELIKIGVILVLCVLAFWGAYTENPTLCYISLIACGIAFILSIWRLIQCFIKEHSCETNEYITRTAILVVFGVVIIAVFLFIRSIQ